MSAWQPIESAPRDGTRILLWPKQMRANSVVAEGYWHQPANPEVQGFWMLGFGATVKGSRGPTHWQPLPEPPCALLGSDLEGSG